MKRKIRQQSLTVALFLFAAMVSTVPASGQLLAYRLIDDLNPGVNGSFPTNFYVYKNSLYFSAYTPATGRELWGFDGTNVTLTTNINNTVTDLGGGVVVGNDSSPANFATYDHVLYFSAFEPTDGDELWRYDGTNAARVTDINPGTGSSFPQELTVMSNELFFSANSGTSKLNYELWKYNGTTASQVANIHPDSGSDYSSYPSGITLFNGALYFMADDGTHGYELWKASSTNAVLLDDINPGSGSSYPQYFTAFNHQLYFQAYTSTYGYELWRTDGTNTSMVADLNPGANSSYPRFLTVFKDALYFQATDGTHGYELWKYDGTDLSLVSNINLTGDSFPEYLTVFSNKLCFAANDGIHGWELWQYNGTNASMVVDLNPSGDSYPEDLTVFDNALYFVATTPATGYEWWRYDGNTVTLATDINPGAGSSYPLDPAVFNESLCFSATDDGATNWEPWMIWVAPFNITAVQKTGADIRLTWNTVGGRTNIVQASDAVNGAFSNLSTPLIFSGSGEIITNFTDTGGATSSPARFYRIVQP